MDDLLDVDSSTPLIKNRAEQAYFKIAILESVFFKFVQIPRSPYLMVYGH